MSLADNVNQATPEPSAFHVPVDAEHTGIRLAGCLTLVGSLVISFVILNAIIPDFWIISGILAVITSAAATHFMDRILKGRWESGRTLSANDEAITISNQDRIERQVDPQQQVNVLTWRFVIKRSGRARKGWYVVALSLEQDGEYVPVYTFVPPDELHDMPLSKRFTELNKKKKAKAGSDRDLRAAGEQRRLMEAEQDRGLAGAEVTYEQFTAFLAYLQANYPNWMIRQA